MAARRGASSLDCSVERPEKFAPRIWLRNNESGSNADLAKGRDGLRSTGHNFYLLERRDVFIALVGSLHNSEKSAGAHAGQKNDYIELAREESRGKRKSFVVGFQR